MDNALDEDWCYKSGSKTMVAAFVDAVKSSCSQTRVTWAQSDKLSIVIVDDNCISMPSMHACACVKRSADL